MSQTRIGITPRDDRSRQCIDAAASQGTPGTAVHDHKPERGQKSLLSQVLLVKISELLGGQNSTQTTVFGGMWNSYAPAKHPVFCCKFLMSVRVHVHMGTGKE